MTSKEHLKLGLITSRNYTLQLLESLSERTDWLHRCAPQGNHAMWIAGHLAVVDNSFIGRKQPAASRADLAEWKDLFGKGSTPVDEPNVYPAPATLLEVMAERRACLLNLLESCTETEFQLPLPAGAPAFMPDYAAMFQMIPWHEAIHSGQLSTIHRQLGHSALR